MVSERGIEVDLEKIRAILDKPEPRTEKEIRGFLGRLQYISRFIARLIVPTCIQEDQRVFVITSSFGASYTNSSLTPILVSLRHNLGMHVILLIEFDIHYVTHKSIRGSIVVDHLVSLPVSDGRAIDDDFRDEDIVVVTSLFVILTFYDRHPATNNIVEYEACILGLETTLELEIRQIEVYGDSNLVLRQIQGEWKIRDVRLSPYHIYLELLVGRFDDLRYTHLPRA
ncbi:hypothetical protein CK203_019773 [Vitis vinifera]|uniref:RNase H type-1 domain-containing protein n=1 Tax=Vitis vinifera TaxID=29760 RepID=A0A438JQK2_VITVI|nr:hypothetical protein CK203_019773 [Vitis vinifera]